MALELDVDNVNAIRFFREVFLEAGKREETIEMGRKAVELAPNHPENVLVLGWRLCMNDHPEEGLRITKRALRLSPYYLSSFLFYSAWCYFFQGDIDNAIAMNQQRREIIPNSKLPLIYLTLMYSAAGRVGEARAAMESFRERSPPISRYRSSYSSRATGTRLMS